MCVLSLCFSVCVYVCERERLCTLDGEESALSALGRPSRLSVSVLCVPSDCGLISKAVGNENGLSLTLSTAAPRGADTMPLIRLQTAESFVNALLPFPTHTHTDTHLHIVTFLTG